MYDYLGRKSTDYSGCHKYVPFAGFSNRTKHSVQPYEIITNIKTAIFLFFLKKSRFFAQQCAIVIYVVGTNNLHESIFLP